MDISVFLIHLTCRQRNVYVIFNLMKIAHIIIKIISTCMENANGHVAGSG